MGLFIMNDLRVSLNPTILTPGSLRPSELTCDPTQQCCPSESTTPNIAPPLTSDAISPAPQVFLTPSQLKEIHTKGKEYRVLEVWFKPKDGLTKEAVMSAFYLTDPNKVHEVTSSQEQKFLVEFPSDRYIMLGYPTLPDPVIPSNDLEAAKQRLVLRLAGLDSLASLGNGYLSVRFTTDKETQQVKDYVVYWISETPQGINVKVLGYKIDNKIGSDTIADAQEVSKALQELLKLNGYLPEGKSAAGIPDDQVVMNSYSYILNNPKLLQPRRQELEDRLRDQWEETKKLLEQYRAIGDSKQVPEEFKPQILSEYAARILSGFAAIRQLAKNGIETFTGEDDAELRKNCQKKREFAESVMKDVLGWIIGDGEGSQGYLQMVELSAAENNILKYLQTIKEWEKLIRRDAPKEKLDEKAIEAGNLAREAINAYHQIFNALRNYEKDFAWIPGVKERCQKLRQEIAKLSASNIIAKFEKEPQRRPARFHRFRSSQGQGRGLDQKDRG